MTLLDKLSGLRKRSAMGTVALSLAAISMIGAAASTIYTIAGKNDEIAELELRVQGLERLNASLEEDNGEARERNSALSSQIFV